MKVLHLFFHIHKMLIFLYLWDIDIFVFKSKIEEIIVKNVLKEFRK